MVKEICCISTILHCETEPTWELYPWKIRLKVWLGIKLSQKELEEHGLQVKKYVADV